MKKNIVWLFGCVVLFICTSGPVILLFENPGTTYIWYVVMQIFVISWFIYGVNHVPFLAAKFKNRHRKK